MPEAKKREVVKKVENAVLYSDGTVRIDRVRLSYPHLDKPYSKSEKETKKFGVVALLDKKLHKAAKDLLLERNKEVMTEAKLPELSSDKKYLRDGDKSGKEEYAGYFTVNAREERRPAIRGRKGEELSESAIASLFYGGCYGSVLIRPWPQNNEYGKRLNAGLSACRFMDAPGAPYKDADPFSENVITSEEIDETFGDLDDGDDDGGFSDDDDDL